MSVRLSLGSLLAMIACGGGAGGGHVRETARPAPHAAAGVAGAGVVPALRAVPEPTGSANARVLAELPAERLESYLSQGRVMGFSADDEYLGYEISRCDSCPTEFHFVSPTKAPIDLLHYSERKHFDPAVQKKTDAEVDRDVAALGVTKPPDVKLRGPFPFPDLVFASATDRNDYTGKVTLLFGARVVGYPPVFPLRVELGPMPEFLPKPPSEMQAHLATLAPDQREKELRQWATMYLLHDPVLTFANVTKDGRDIGVVAVATGIMWYEAAGVARMPARDFAARVYNDTAMRFHAAGKFAQAAALFEKAEIAAPTDSLFSYNLACARARLGDARAEEALARAIAHGGPRLAARARADADFAGVSAQAWFRALVGQ